MHIVTSAREIKQKLNLYKKNVLAQAQKYPKVNIGYSHKTGKGTLYYLQQFDMWMLIEAGHSTNHYCNYFGIGEVKEGSKANNITIEINVAYPPARQCQGRLLRHNNSYYLAHTGIFNIGRGNKHPHESEHFAKRSYSTTDGNEKIELYCIAKILDEGQNTKPAELAKLMNYLIEIRHSKNEHKDKVPSWAATTLLESEEGERSTSEREIYKRCPGLVRTRKRMDAYTCTICGFHHADKIVHVHHINPIANRITPQNTHVDDLITLCPNCHALAHMIMRQGEDDWTTIRRKLHNFHKRA